MEEDIYCALLIQARNDIHQAMVDLVEHAPDTLWLTATETVFERLAFIYMRAGGDRADLQRDFHEYFD